MSRRTTSFFVVSFLGAALLLCSTASFAQFTASIQGVVQDPSGAGIPKATVKLVNEATRASQTASTDAAGNFRFLSLAPGSYKVMAEAGGFARSEVDVTLLTERTLNLPVTLKIGTATEAVTVTSAAPVVDPADNRNQLTLES